MVAVGGSIDAPRVLDRRRLVIADPDLPGSKQPYHAAAGRPFGAAEALIRTAIESSQGLACEAISVAVNLLRSRGHEVTACAVLLGSGRPLPDLDRILASHALIHTAEGEMFRNVLVWGARQCSLPVGTIREKDLDPAALLRIKDLGKLIGPPWTQDQKNATAAALSVLAGSTHA